MSDGRGVFIEDIYRDEMRGNFLVTSHRKKLWNVELNLLWEFARICAEHDLRWFAIGGTLLGAARHGGFIPWDFDIDVIMFRPDYDEFQRIAAEEVRSPYFLDVWYNYRLESEGELLDDSEFQFITAAQEQVNGIRWLTQFPSIRLRDNRTTMIEFPERNFINQGIWIDIFPLDPLPPFANKEQALFFETAKILLMAASQPTLIREAMRAELDLFLDYDALEEFLACSYRERGKIFEQFMTENYFESERAGDLRDYCLTTAQRFYRTKDFAGVSRLPFEKIEVPAPVGYESVLTDFYGEWRTPVVMEPHYQLHSADIPWQEYFARQAGK